MNTVMLSTQTFPYYIAKNDELKVSIILKILLRPKFLVKYAATRPIMEKMGVARKIGQIIPKSETSEPRLNIELSNYLVRSIKQLGEHEAQWLVRIICQVEVGSLDQSRAEEQLRKVIQMSIHDRSFFYNLSKRIFDFVFALSALVFLSPLLIACAVIIKSTTKGPIIFRQLRAGRYNTPFWVFKFRTMHLDAEKKFTGLKPIEKSETDNRVTTVGKILRKYKIDELPQLINVIRGQMSIVGPRPLPIDEEYFVPRKYFKRLAVYPGLTGLWQAYYPNTISPKLKFKLDELYISKKSFRLDLYLIVKTFGMIFSGKAEKKYQKLRALLKSPQHTAQDKEKIAA